MPTIGRATIDVDYDGGRMPAEARRIAEEAGREGGDGFGEQFRRRYDQHMDDAFRDYAKRWDREGAAAGRKFGDAYSGNVTRDLDKLADRVSHVFSDTDGLDAYRERLFGVGHETGNVTRSTDILRGELRQLKDSGQLTGDEFDTLNKRVTVLGRTLRGVETREVNARTRDLGDAMREADEAVRKLDPTLNEHNKLRERLNQLSADGSDAKGYRDLTRDANEMDAVLRRVDETFGRLNPRVDTNRNAFERLGRLIREGGTADDFRDLDRDAGRLADRYDGDLTRAMASVDRAFLNLNPRLEKNHELFTRLGELGRNGGTADDFRGLARDAENLAGRFDDLGPSIDRAGNSANKHSNSFGKLFRAFGRFDPGDNMGQLFALLVAVAGPLAAGISALGAQVVIAGTAFVGAGVGAVALAVAFKGMFGDVSKLPAAVRPAAQALQDLKDPLLKLQDQLQVATFKDMAGHFKALGDALPGLSGGVKAIGGALNDFLGKLTDGITNNIGPINNLLKGFAPIIRDMGGTIVNLTGVFGGLFRAAMPFAQDFARDLEASTKKFSDFLNSVKGQNQLRDWFNDAKPVMDALGRAIGDVGEAFKIMVTPESAKTLIGLLDNIGSLVKNLAKISDSLNPALRAVGDLIELAGDVVAAFAPIAHGVGSVLDGIVTAATPVVRYFIDTFKPAIKVVGDALDVLGQVWSQNVAPVLKGAFEGLSAAIKPFGAAIETASGTLKDKLIAGITIAKPAFEALGGVLKVAGQAIGVFGGELVKAIGQTTLFKGAGETMSNFLDGDFKAGVQRVTGVFKDISTAIRTQVIPAIKEIDWGKVTNGLDKLEDVGPQVVKFFTQLGGAIKDAFEIVGNYAPAVATLVGAMGKLASGDILGAATDMGKFGAQVKEAADKSGPAFDDLGKRGKAMGDAVGKAAKDVGGAMNDFKAAGDTNLGALATRFGLTGDAGAAFRGAVVNAAKEAGVGLGNLKNSTDLQDLELRLGATGGAAKAQFADKIVAAMKQSGVAIGDLPPQIQALIDKYSGLPAGKSTKVEAEGADQAKQKVADLDKQIQGLKDKVVKAQEDGASASSDRVKGLQQQIAALENKKVAIQEEGAAPSQNRVKTLHDAIDTLAGRTVPVEENGAAPAKTRVTNLHDAIDNLAGRTVPVEENGAAPAKTRVTNLHDAIDNLAARTVAVSENGAAPAKGRVDNLHDAINTLAGKTVTATANVNGQGAVSTLEASVRALQDKTVTITARYQQAGGTLGATGGLMVGGQLMQKGPKAFRRFALGGITSGSMFRGSALVGEAGPEAIVPLSGALTSVDKSVRALSAYARGRTLPGSSSGGDSRTMVLEKGAVQVISASTSPSQTASAVIDRLSNRMGL